MVGQNLRGRQRPGGLHRRRLGHEAAIEVVETPEDDDEDEDDT